MASKIDFSKFTFSAEQIRDINELVFDEILHAPDLNFIHTLHSGIVYDKEIGFIGEGGLVGIAKQGCDPDTQDWAISTRKVTWAPKGWEIFLEECASDLENTAAVYAMNTGNKMDDLTDTDYMAIVAQVLDGAVRDFFYRVLWLGDTDAANVVVEKVPTAAVSEQTGQTIVGTVYAGVTSSTEGAVKCALADKTVVYLAGSAASGAPAEGTTYYTKDTEHKITLVSGGSITPGVSTAYFTLLNGFFKQLRTAVTATGSLGVNIAANEEASFAAQDAAMDANAAYALLSAMYYKAPIEMRGSGKMRFLVTQSIADAYQQYLIGKGIESTFKNLVDGVPALKFLGVDVIPMPIWDKQIRAYEKSEYVYDRPHRAVLIEKENLAVGTPSNEAYEGFDIWYDKKSRKNYILAQDKIDGKLLNDKRFIYAE